MRKVIVFYFFILFLSMASFSYAQMDHAVQNQPGKVGDWKDSGFGAGMVPSKDKLPAGDGMNDHLASIFNSEGDVRILKKGTDQWGKAKKGMLIEPGDKLITGKKSFVEIVYDKYFLNIARIDEHTQAEFRSIEPTDFHLEDGSVFNALDGLAPESQYQVSTPTAVAGVRGTYFDVMYQAETGLFSCATIPVDDDHLSQVYIQPGDAIDTSGREIIVPEGSQITLSETETPDAGLVVEINPETVQEARETFQEMTGAIENFTELREEGEKELADLSDDQKPAGDGHPPGGGDGGADSMNQDGASQPNLDALMDTLIPADSGFTGAVPLPQTDENQKADGESNGAKQESGDSAQAENVDPESMMKFLSLGGLGNTKGEGQRDSMTQVLSALGVSADSEMAQDITRAAETWDLPAGHDDTGIYSAHDSFQVDLLSQESFSFEHDLGSVTNEQTKSEENYTNSEPGSSPLGCSGY